MSDKPSIISMMDSDDEELNQLAYELLLAMIYNPTSTNEMKELCDYILASIENAHAYQNNFVSPNIHFRNCLNIVRNWCENNSR